MTPGRGDKLFGEMLDRHTLLLVTWQGAASSIPRRIQATVLAWLEEHQERCGTQGVYSPRTRAVETVVLGGLFL